MCLLMGTGKHDTATVTLVNSAIISAQNILSKVRKSLNETTKINVITVYIPEGFTIKR